MQIVLSLCLVLNATQCIAESRTAARCELIGGDPVVRRGAYQYRLKGVRCGTGNGFGIAWGEAPSFGAGGR